MNLNMSLFNIVASENTFHEEYMTFRLLKGTYYAPFYKM